MDSRSHINLGVVAHVYNPNVSTMRRQSDTAESLGGHGLISLAYTTVNIHRKQQQQQRILYQTRWKVNAYTSLHLLTCTHSMASVYLHSHIYKHTHHTHTQEKKTQEFQKQQIERGHGWKQKNNEKLLVVT